MRTVCTLCFGCVQTLNVLSLGASFGVCVRTRHAHANVYAVTSSFLLLLDKLRSLFVNSRIWGSTPMTVWSDSGICPRYTYLAVLSLQVAVVAKRRNIHRPLRSAVLLRMHSTTRLSSSLETLTLHMASDTLDFALRARDFSFIVLHSLTIFGGGFGINFARLRNCTFFIHAFTR